MTKPAYRAFPVRVDAVETLTPSFRRVTFASDDLADLGWDGPDQRIKVVLPLPDTGLSTLPTSGDWYQEWRRLPDHQRNPIRTYTIRGADARARRLVVDFALHGDGGPASRWVGQARVGDEVVVIAPDATSPYDAGGYEWRPGRATALLIAGDETAVPAVATILESLPDDASGAAFLEVPHTEDVLPLRVPDGVRLTWLARDADRAGRRDNAGRGGHGDYGELLSHAVRTWVHDWLVEHGGAERGPDLPTPDDDLLWEAPAASAGPGLYAWLAGEAGAVTGLRRHLVRDLGLDRSQVAFMGYWKLGRAES